MAKPILTLTTDFGLTDHFVGVMKGVILSICPQAQIVDISHEVAPFAIAEGAYLIAQAYPYFPKNTVHIVVVDPGVGTARRPVLVEAAGQYFVAPDNGVLEMIYSREKHQVRAITDPESFSSLSAEPFTVVISSHPQPRIWQLAPLRRKWAKGLSIMPGRRSPHPGLRAATAGAAVCCTSTVSETL